MEIRRSDKADGARGSDAGDRWVEHDGGSWVSRSGWEFQHGGEITDRVPIWIWAMEKIQQKNLLLELIGSLLGFGVGEIPIGWFCTVERFDGSALVEFRLRERVQRLSQGQNFRFSDGKIKSEIRSTEIIESRNLFG